MLNALGTSFSIISFYGYSFQDVLILQLLNYCQVIGIKMTAKMKIYNHSIFQKGRPSVYGSHYNINLLEMIPKWNMEPGILESTPEKTDSEDDKSSDDEEQVPFEFKEITTYEVDRMNQEVQVNQYMVSKLLGKGAQGMVRMASDTKKLYAIKIINCDKLRKKYFVKANELKLLSKIHHTNVIRFYEALYSQEYEKLCIVLEYCSRGSLHALISNEATAENWTVKVKVIVRQCLEGLFYLHNNSIAHRDIKSQNILVAEKQVIKYCDFNISSKVQNPVQTNLGFQGTKLYGAPQLLVMTNNIVSPYAADVWALGMTLLEVALRKHPFAEKTLQQLQQAVKQQIEIPTTIDVQLGDLLSKMLNLDWRKRPTAKQMLFHPYVKG